MEWRALLKINVLRLNRFSTSERLWSARDAGIKVDKQLRSQIDVRPVMIDITEGGWDMRVNKVFLKQPSALHPQTLFYTLS